MKRLGVFAGLILLSACATVGSLGSRTVDYRSYIESRTVVERVFDRGAQTFAIKVVPVDAQLIALQEQIMAGRALELKPARRLLIVAATNFGSARFFRSDLQLKLGGREAISLREVTSSLELRQLYAQFQPHFRVFIAEFDAGAERETLEVSRVTPKLEIPVEFTP